MNTKLLPDSRGKRVSRSITGGDNGTTCSAPLFMRLAGTVQVLAARLISLHLPPSVSPLLAVVRMVKSNALAATPSHLVSSDMKAGTSAYGKAE
jgi:hypothetical protein